MQKINFQQYIGLLNEIVTYNHDYKIDLNGPKVIQAIEFTNEISQSICHQLLDIVECESPTDKKRYQDELKRSIGIIIGNSKFVREDMFIDLTKTQTDKALEAFSNVILKNTRKLTRENKAFIEQFKTIIKELKEPFGPASIS
jgi:hypothetical protein